MEYIITLFFLFLGGYFAFGFVFSLFFLWKGLAKVDPTTAGTSLGFKLLLLPGLTAFWLLFFFKWLKASRS